MNEIFQWVLLTLTAFRLQRIVTADKWPPSEWFREGLKEQFGEESSWYLFFTCPWCFGFWATLGVFSIAAYVVNVPYPILQSLAATAVVGILGSTYD